MRTTKTRKFVIPGALVGVLGVLGFALGPGRADAAAATKVSRYNKEFTVNLKVTGGASFTCNKIKDNPQKSVTASVGTTKPGAGRSFSCTSGSQVITLNYTLINTYGANKYSTATHSWSLTWRVGTNNHTCKTWTKGTDQKGFVENSFGVQWNQKYLSTSNSGSCGGVTVSASAEWLEGWSAS